MMKKWCGVRVMLPTGEVHWVYNPGRVFSDLPPREIWSQGRESNPRVDGL